MSELASLFLQAMTTYGPPALALALFLGPLGVPIPTALLVTAAGALARQGLLAWATALLLGLAATLLGDSLSYALGRFAGGWVQRLAGGRGAAAWRRAQVRFRRQGGLGLYGTRFLLTALDVPTNLIAGGSQYPFTHFFAWDLVGRLTWILLYGGLGYLLGSQWQTVTQLTGHCVVLLGIAVVVGMGAFALLRRLRQSNRPLRTQQPASCGETS